MLYSFKYKKTMCVLFIILLVISLFSSCRDNNSENKFAYDLIGDPVNMDPQIAKTSSAKTVLANSMEGLLTFDKSGNIIGGVAREYEVSEDGLTYLFKLRDNANWITNKGEIYANVTAHDFVYAFHRLFDRDINSSYAYDFAAIKNASGILRGELGVDQLGVKALDSLTLEIKLEYEYSLFPQLLTTPPAMPCNQQFFIETKGTYGLEAKSILYNGPFYISLWNQGTRITTRISQNYNSTEPAVASSVTFFISQPQSQTAQDDENDESRLESEEVKVKTPLEKFTEETTDAIILSAEQSTGLDISKYPNQMYEDTLWFFTLNTDNEVLQNRNIRLALMYSLSGISFDQYLPPSMVQAKALVPHIVTGVGNGSYRDFVGEDLTLKYNPEIAKTYLAQGMADLGVFSFPKITISYPENEYLTEIMQNILRQWQSDLSIFINISPLTNEELKKNVNNGSYDIALTSIRSVTNSPTSILGMFSQDSVLGYESEIYGNLLLKGATSTNLEESQTFYGEAERTIIQDGVVFPVAYQSSNYLVGKNVSNVYFSPFGDIVYFKYGVIS